MVDQNRRKDLQRRLAVYFLERKQVILVLRGGNGIYSRDGIIPGFPRKNRDEGKVLADRRAEAEALRLDPRVYRQSDPNQRKSDTGHRKFHNEKAVKIYVLIEQLKRMGFLLIECYYSRTSNGVYNYLVFSREPGGFEIKMPWGIKKFRILDEPFRVSVFCNVQFQRDEAGNILPNEPKIRKDTVNLNPYPRSYRYRELVIFGRTWRLMSYKEAFDHVYGPWPKLDAASMRHKRGSV